MNIENDCVVSIHYTLTNPNGDVLDSSEGRDPLVYLQGRANIIPGLEQALSGAAEGDNITAVIPPEDAYGLQDPNLMQVAPRDALAHIEDLEVGMQLQSKAPDGQVQSITVDAITEEEVTLNGNHPLAGVTLHFDVKVESIRQATDEELEHGHAH